MKPNSIRQQKFTFVYLTVNLLSSFWMPTFMYLNLVNIHLYVQYLFNYFVIIKEEIN